MYGKGRRLCKQPDEDVCLTDQLLSDIANNMESPVKKFVEEEFQELLFIEPDVEMHFPEFEIANKLRDIQQDLGTTLDTNKQTNLDLLHSWLCCLQV